jgi:hypothetical protein
MPCRAQLPRWPVLDGDFELSERDPKALAVSLTTRKLVKIMKIADYDHDGWATKFPLQVCSVPAGTRLAILVGTSRRQPKLHAFGTVLHPNQPLYIRAQQWDELLNEKTTPLRVVVLSCGNHGSEEQWEYELRTDQKGIHATKFVYSCGDGFSPDPLKAREEF